MAAIELKSDRALVPRDEGEAYALAEELDAEVLAKSLAGVPVDILCYKFKTTGGQVVSGVTAKGALVLAAAMARRGTMHLTEQEPQIEDRGQTYYVKVAMTNLQNGVTFYGVAEAPKTLERRDGTAEPDRFALPKAHAVARRRAIMAHFAGEEKLIQQFVEEQQRQGRAFVSGESQVIQASALAHRQAGAALVPRLGEEEKEMVRAAMRETGVTKRQIAAFCLRRWGATELSQVPADGLQELLAWIRSQAPDGTAAADEAAGESEAGEPQEHASAAESLDAAAEDDTSAGEAAAVDQLSGETGQPAPGTDAAGGAVRRNGSRYRRDRLPMSGNVTRPPQGEQNSLL